MPTQCQKLPKKLEQEIIGLGIENNYFAFPSYFNRQKVINSSSKSGYAWLTAHHS